MSRVSVAGLDLTTSALAAAVLLYVVTIQEILLFPKSLQDRGSFLIQVSLHKPEEGKCKIGVFLQKDNNSFFPKDRSDDAMIEPRHFGAIEYKVRLSVQKGRPVFDDLVVLLHACDEQQRKPQRISVDILGAIATPRFQVILAPHEISRKLNMEKIKNGHTRESWLLFR